MTAEQFAYWLQGFVELGKGAAPTPEQWKSIREHLDTVFTKVTPPVKTDVSEGTKAFDLAKAIRDLQSPPSTAVPLQWWQGYPPGTAIC